MKKKILTLAFVVLCVVGAFATIYFPNSNMNNIINEAENIILQEIVVSEQTEELAIQTKEATNNEEDISTVEVIESSIEEETEVVDEGAIEADAVVEQENISYDGDITGNGLSLLGVYQGITYYNQRRFTLG